MKAWNKVQKFIQLSAADKQLLRRAVWKVGLARLGLWFFPLSTVRRLMKKTARPAVFVAAPERVGWSVSVMSRFIPGASCLVQAVAAQTLLSQSGQESELLVGVALDGGKDFRAHAWVKCEGEIIVGGAQTDQYSQLLSLDA